MQSIVEKIVNGKILRNVHKSNWYTHIIDHSEYLRQNAATVDIPPVTFAHHRRRPIYLLRSLGVEEEDIEIILILNGISRITGFTKSQTRILIPNKDRLSYLKNSFNI